MSPELELEWARLKARFREREEHAERLATAGKPVRMSHPRYPHLRQLVSIDVAEPGKWRMTTFSNGEPLGHITLNTALEAFKLALHEGNLPD